MLGGIFTDRSDAGRARAGPPPRGVARDTARPQPQPPSHRQHTALKIFLPIISQSITNNQFRKWIQQRNEYTFMMSKTGTRILSVLLC